MSLRRALQLLVLAALMLAPFGRIGMAEARSVPGVATMNCAGQPPSRDPGDHSMRVDCLIACAAMAPQADFAFDPPAPPARAVPGAVPAPTLDGLQPEADPPPPRLS